MAKETAKKNWRRNAARMYIFTMITVVINVLYVLRIMYRNGGLPGFSDLLAIAFWAGQEYVALRWLKQVALPTFNAQGELLDCIDASDPEELGYYSFVQDVLWVCWVVQALCMLHGAFVVFYLPVPATIIYKVWHTFIRPLLALRFGIGASPANDNNSNNNNEKGTSSGNAPRNRQERRKEELRQRKAQRKSAATSVHNRDNDDDDGNPFK